MAKRIEFVFAEDQSLIRRSLIVLLQQHNIICVGEAENGIELLDLLKGKTPDFILLDVRMPKMDGMEALERIKRQYPSMKVILLTVQHGQYVKESFYTRGADAFLTKNTSEKVLVDTIRAVHNNKHNPQRETLNKNLKFSPRELEIITLVYMGKTNKEIADILCIVIKTVEAHKKKLYLKTKVLNSIEFVKYIEEHGLYYLK
jgi:DNA-binding NarL/FixJ family response regulator